jgi:hypothetical protein
MFRKLDMFSFPDEGREISTPLGPLERANLGPNRVCVSLP